MSWAGNIPGEVRNMFREAQRFSRGIFPRVADEDAPRLPPRVEVTRTNGRRRIVAPRTEEA